MWDDLQQKWKEHNYLQKKMQEIVKEYGITGQVQIERMARSIGVNRVEVKGKNFTCVRRHGTELYFWAFRQG